MIFKQLLQNNSWLSIASVLVQLYPDEEDNIEDYESVYYNLLMKNPEGTDMWIVIKTVIDDFDGSAYIDVSGKYRYPNNEEETFLHAIEFTHWNKWLGMEIYPGSLKDFSELDIIAHCLYEMTFAGFEEEEVQEQLTSLKKTMEDYEMMTEEEKLKNRISMEGFLDELMADDQENEHS